MNASLMLVLDLFAERSCFLFLARSRRPFLLSGISLSFPMEYVGEYYYREAQDNSRPDVSCQATPVQGHLKLLDNSEDLCYILKN